MNTSKSATSFTGASQSGDLAEALGHAIKQAIDSSRIADALVTWTNREDQRKEWRISRLEGNICYHCRQDLVIFTAEASSE